MANSHGGRTIALVAGSLCLLVACARTPAEPAPPQPGDRLVARVDGAPIWTSEVKREAVVQGMIGQGDPLDARSLLFRQVLDQVVDEKLLAAEALRQHLDKDPATQGRLASARDRVLGDALLERSVGKTVNDDAVNALYQEMVANETPSEVIKLRQIVLATPGDAQQVKELLARGASFDALAAERSRDDATRFKGGEMATTTVDMLAPAYAQAVAKAGTGQIVGPFRAESGWVVARIDDRHRETPITLDVARPQIIRFLTYDRVKDLILTLRRRAKVQTLLASGPAYTATEPASAPPPARPIANEVIR